MQIEIAFQTDNNKPSTIGYDTEDSDITFLCKERVTILDIKVLSHDKTPDPCDQTKEEFAAEKLKQFYYDVKVWFSPNIKKLVTRTLDNYMRGLTDDYNQ